MKKMTAILLTLALAVSLLAGCGAKAPAAEEKSVAIEGTPTEIIEKIYAQHKAVDLALVTMDVDLSDADAVAYNLGLSSSDKIEAAAMSETMLGQPYSMAVVRVKNADDAAAVAKEMYDNIDTRKWICVAADTKAVAYAGDVVVFFMVSSDFAEDASTDTIMEAFRAVAGSATVVD